MPWFKLTLQPIDFNNMDHDRGFLLAGLLICLVATLVTGGSYLTVFLCRGEPPGQTGV